MKSLLIGWMTKPKLQMTFVDELIQSLVLLSLFLIVGYTAIYLINRKSK